MISVVIPVYNGEKFLRETYRMADAAAKRLPDGVTAEFLFVDDGSTDNSGDIIEELAASDKRVRHIRKENGGIASARTEGLMQAAGEYVCFIDQDDIIKPDMFLILCRDLAETGADFVQAKADTFLDDGGSVASGKRKDSPAGEGRGASQGAGAIKRLAPDTPSPAAQIKGVRVVDAGTAVFRQYLRMLIMRGLVNEPGCEVSGSIWCCMFRTAFLRENNITFYRFCDYEDDWIFLTLAMVCAERFCMEEAVVYSWRIHAASESHNRAKSDRYIEDFYEKHRLLRAFFAEALKNAGLSEAQEERFCCEMQKQALLWSLSNETGRGIKKHTERESAAILAHVVEHESYEGIWRHINRHPLYISVAGAHGLRRFYYVFRDKFLTFLLLHKQILLAVRLNRRVFHGRWHI